MKNIIFILLFACSFCNGQDVLVSFYDADTYDYLEARFLDHVPPCDTIVVGTDTIHRCATIAKVPEDWSAKRYDPQTQTFYNAATLQEQELYLAKKAADAVDPSATTASNPALVSRKTDAELNALYPQPAPFWLFCENIEGGIIYLKGAEGWRVVPTYSNNN